MNASQDSHSNASAALRQIIEISGQLADGYLELARRFRNAIRDAEDKADAANVAWEYDESGEVESILANRASNEVERLSSQCSAWSHVVEELARLCMDHLPTIPRRYVRSPLHLFWHQLDDAAFDSAALELRRIETEAAKAAGFKDAATTEQFTDPTKIPPRLEPRLRVENDVVFIDEKPHKLKGSDAVRGRLAQFIMDLIEANGEYIQRPEQLKTRDIERQETEIRDMIESQQGAGTRINPLFFKRPT